MDDGSTVYAVAQQLASDVGGHYMDQFTYAERATDWRGNNNIAETIFDQMRQEAHPIPRWIVVGAGTGGTASTIGRFIRYQGHDTRLCVVDPQHSVTFDYFRTGDATLRLDRGSGVEGIGRPRVEPSFIRTVVDQMIKVPDEASYAAMLFLHKLMAKRAGPSTGTNLWGAFELIADMAAARRRRLDRLADLRFGRALLADVLRRRVAGAAQDRLAPLAAATPGVRGTRRMAGAAAARLARARATQVSPALV